jgi:hypothetical protein
MYVEGPGSDGQIDAIARLQAKARAEREGSGRFLRSDQLPIVPEEGAAPFLRSDELPSVVREEPGPFLRSDQLPPASSGESAPFLRSDQLPDAVETGPGPFLRSDQLPEETASEPVKGGEKSGVVSLLQEGHFRGVADVRLRTNFSEELQRVELAATQRAVSEGLNTLQEGTNAVVDTFVARQSTNVEVTGTIRSAQSGFNAELSTLSGETGTVPEADVFGELRTIFRDFLQSLMPPRETESADDTTVLETTAPPAESTTSSVSNGEAPAAPVVDSEVPVSTDAFAGLRESLTSFFNDFIANLQDSVNDLGLPALSEPSGNGRAYEQFLAAYNDAVGGEEDSVPTPLDKLT